MSASVLSDRRRHLLTALSRYWPTGSEAIAALAVPEAERGPWSLPPKLLEVALPAWAADVGVGGCLLVPAEAVSSGDGEAWRRTDWWLAAAWYLDGLAERAHEAAHGPIHSYSFRLAGWDGRIWDHAWVNRIALFLRRWAAEEGQTAERELFGPAPRGEIVLTHDVDAIAKTLAIRFKQSAFHGYNAARRLIAGDVRGGLARLFKAARFFTSRCDYWAFEDVTALEAAYGLRSHFNVYGGPGGAARTWRQRLLDPAYRADEARLSAQLRALRAGGWTIGLHQSFEAWADAERMRAERERVEAASGGTVRSCRQHWLRFSWRETWPAQAAAGLTLDTTLGFNDRPGFRNGCALRFRPGAAGAAPMAIEALPMVLMDSHLYDYQPLDEAAREAATARWLDEVFAVGGVATVIWHTQVMNDDYGWRAGYVKLLSLLAERLGSKEE